MTPELRELVDIAIKLLLAVIFGGVVGWQRETHDRPAGLRTHVLVSVGSCTYMLVSLRTPGDPGRIAAQVATGMGFLGAGTIIRHGNIVRGLTTAASLWAVAAVGLCIGRGGMALSVAAITTVLILLTLTTLTLVEKRLLRKREYRLLMLTLPGAGRRLAEVQEILLRHGLRINSVEILQPALGVEGGLNFIVRLPPGASVPEINAELAQLPGLCSFQWE
jgi:putative Mg2+ transporter-C (MgtC) family protein